MICHLCWGKPDLDPNNDRYKHCGVFWYFINAYDREMCVVLSSKHVTFSARRRQDQLAVGELVDGEYKWEREFKPLR